MNKEELYKIIEAIYDWPIEKDSAWKIYSNFLELILSGDQNIIMFLSSLTKFDKKNRQKYRQHLADRGFEIRPDELNQYILLIIIAMTKSVEVGNG